MLRPQGEQQVFVGHRETLPMEETEVVTRSGEGKLDAVPTSKSREGVNREED